MLVLSAILIRTGRNGDDRVHKPQLEGFLQEWETSKPDEEQLKALIARQCAAVEERAKVSLQGVGSRSF